MVRKKRKQERRDDQQDTATKRRKANEPFDGQQDEATMEDQVNQMQRNDPVAKRQWRLYCDVLGDNLYDPAKHDITFLEDFITQFKAGERWDDVQKETVKSIVDQVKEMQRSDPVAKAQWNLYCEVLGENTKDPAKLDTTSIRDFIKQFEEGVRWDDQQDEASMVEQIKKMQRSDPAAKAQWYTYCEVFGGNVRDPARHEDAFLRDFATQYRNGVRWDYQEEDEEEEKEGDAEEAARDEEMPAAARRRRRRGGQGRERPGARARSPPGPPPQWAQPSNIYAREIDGPRRGRSRSRGRGGHSERVPYGKPPRRGMDEDAWQRQREENNRAGAEGRTLYARGLPPSWTTERLEEFFGHQGRVTGSHLLPMKPGQPGRAAFVNFATAEDTISAAQVCDCLKIDEDGERYNLVCSIKGGIGKKVSHVSGFSALSLAKQEKRAAYFSNMPGEFDEEAVRMLCSPHGTVLGAQILKNKAGLPTKSGFAIMSSKEEVEKLIAALDGQMVNGKTLTVAFPTPPKQTRNSGSVDGYFIVEVRGQPPEATALDLQSIMEAQGHSVQTVKIQEGRTAWRSAWPTRIPLHARGGGGHVRSDGQV
ncbi:unnamed protein product [Prorocentrum cordatum]|uniref:RRM domain-containing protein n=1 Tax=Prorocentrum cordatum TaxID=2364126 RepID=A0ABN9Y076_9DINO|nr:unnamed protein product [Polarella glacialis]